MSKEKVYVVIRNDGAFLHRYWQPQLGKVFSDWGDLFSCVHFDDFDTANTAKKQEKIQGFTVEVCEIELH